MTYIYMQDLGLAYCISHTNGKMPIIEERNYKPIMRLARRYQDVEVWRLCRIYKRKVRLENAAQSLNGSLCKNSSVHV